MKLSGADILIKTLIEQGIKVVFGYPGGQVINIYDSLYKYGDEITHVLTAHEQGAVHAADGYARATGGIGAVHEVGGVICLSFVCNGHDYDIFHSDFMQFLDFQPP